MIKYFCEICGKEFNRFDTQPLTIQITKSRQLQVWPVEWIESMYSNPTKSNEPWHICKHCILVAVAQEAEKYAG